MAQGRSTKNISMIKWIRTSRLSIKNSLSAGSDLDVKAHRLVHIVLLPLDLEPEVQGLRFMVHGLGLRVWSLGFWG